MSEIQANFKTADEAPDNPYDLFDNWFAQAQQSEPRDPNVYSGNIMHIKVIENG